jgi:hypothetical protein
MADLKLMGSRLIHISGKREPEFDGKLSINTNIKITNIEQMKDSKEAIRVEYDFNIDYGDLGSIDLHGILFFQANSKTIKSLAKSWKEKKFDSQEHMRITNVIIQKATVKALEIEEELGLPMHIRLPSVKPKEE